MLGHHRRQHQRQGSVQQINPLLNTGKSYAVKTIEDIPLRDSHRNRQVPLKIYFPQESGTYPIILFSHGAGGSKDGFSHLGEFWASRGYVAIHLTHLGTDTLTLKTQGLQAIFDEADDPEHWRERVQDISFVIDSLAELETIAPQLQGKLNRSEIGVAGHSFGAFTSLLIAGTTVITPWSENTTFLDARVQAVLAISPQGTGQQGLHDRSWDHLRLPVMTITGTEDEGRAGQPAAWREEPFEQMPTGEKYLLVIAGAQHSSYGDRNRNGSGARAIVRIVSTAFWDAHLKKDVQGQEFLHSNALNERSRGKASLQWK